MLRRFTCGANLWFCASKRVESDEDITHQEEIKKRLPSKFSRILNRGSNDRELRSTETKKRSFLSWKSKRNDPPTLNKSARVEKGFSMYGKNRATNSEKELKKIKRRKKRKERNATLSSRVNKKSKEKHKWKTNERQKGHLGEMSGSWSDPGICEMSKIGGKEKRQGCEKHSKHRQERDKSHHKQDEKEYKRRKSGDRKKESELSSHRQNDVSKPKRKHSRRLKKSPMERIQSHYHGDEDGTGKWEWEWEEREGMGRDHKQSNGEHRKDRNGTRRRRSSEQRHGKRDGTTKRSSNASYLDEQAFINPYHSPSADPSPLETWTSSLHRVEAWQERCSAEIDSARRKLEHRLTQLETKLERQSSEEWDKPPRVEGAKNFLREEYERMFDRVTDECHAILASQREMLDNMTEEIRAAVQAGFDRLEEKLAQLGDGNNMQYPSTEKPGMKCEMKCGLKVRVARHAAAVDCDSILQNGATMASRVSQSDALDAREEPGDLNGEGPQIDNTSAAQQVRHQRELQDLERRYKARAEEEQSVLCARIRELEGLLMDTGAGNTKCYV